MIGGFNRDITDVKQTWQDRTSAANRNVAVRLRDFNRQLQCCWIQGMNTPLTNEVINASHPVGSDRHSVFQAIGVLVIQVSLRFRGINSLKRRSEDFGILLGN